jgi:hypothetical protein
MSDQSHQLPVLAAADKLSKEFDCRFLYSVDERHSNESPSERGKVVRSLADVRVELDAPTILSAGLPTETLEPTIHQNCESRQFSLEAKPSPYDAVNSCMPVDSKRDGKKGQMPVPFWLSTFQPACDTVTDIYVTGREVQRCVRRGSNVSDFLIHLSQSGPLDESTVVRAHRDKVCFAPILRAMGVPCVVLSQFVDFDAYEREVESAIE